MKHGLSECDVGTETKMKSCSIDDHRSQQPSEIDIRIPFLLLEPEGVFSTREAAKYTQLLSREFKCRALERRQRGILG